MPFNYEAQPKIASEWCNLCGADRFAQVANVDRYGLPVRVVKCLGCGLRFINPRMTDEAYEEFYRSGQYRNLLTEFYGRPITLEKIEHGQERYAKKVSRFLSRHMNGHKTMLDVGGSTGIVARELRSRFGLGETFILDPSEDETQRARRNTECLRVIRGTLVDWEDRGKVGLVTLCQTVEHLTDIKRDLRKIHSILKDGGILFVDISTDPTPKVDHCYYPTKSTMRLYLESAGFEIKWRNLDAFKIIENSTRIMPAIRNPKKVSFVAVKK